MFPRRESGSPEASVTSSVQVWQQQRVICDCTYRHLKGTESKMDRFSNFLPKGLSNVLGTCPIYRHLPHIDRPGVVICAKKANTSESRGVLVSPAHESDGLPGGGILQRCGIRTRHERPQTREFPYWHDRGVSARAGSLAGAFPDPAGYRGLMLKHLITGCERGGTAPLPRQIKQHGSRATGVKRRDELRLKRSALFRLMVLNTPRETCW